ncbi:Protein DENND6A DENN domain-containing protein 6A [Triplophysa tibetana]|uniref:Protein DENND6A DENN domain-containing protein 6A n=1 Tax=Triplophysa tibetana TaxID=1572043 RepID=A0A5A9NF91_9TELE|nr:Protein DENND6A DENN domain-containing protein 6A [Triplophysa tibetana]
MAFQGSEEVEEQLEEPEETLRVSPAEEMPVDGPPAAEEPEPLLLPWDRFSAWLHCICVVGFDLELGQAVEVIYPHHSKLSEKEKTSICYLSFPDSNSGRTYGHFFSHAARDAIHSCCGNGMLVAVATEFLPPHQISRSCLGDTQFCFRFRQAVDRKSSLGCFLDHFDRDAPVCLKRDQGYYYGYVYFRQVRDKTLKRGYFQKSLVLVSKLPYVTFFHSLLKLIAPEYFEKQEPCLEAACNDIDRWPTPSPGKILSLPIMGVVMKLRIPTCYDKPGTSQLVQSAPSDSLVSIVLPTVHEVDLFSCISPLRYCSDFRPYFTIHDSEFKEYTTRTQAPPSVILGVTNPFFAKTLQHWPHIIRIGDMKQTGVYSAYKPFLNKDEDIIKQLQKGVQQKRPSAAQNAILRRYFLELTQSFIIPLERYVASLMPLQKTISPWKSSPQLRPFIQEEFMKTLEKAGPQLTSRLKGDWIGLYRQFLRSPNFDGWFRNRRKEMTQKLEALHLEALCEEDLQLRIQKHTEVETVDLVLKLKEKLTQAEKDLLPVKPGTIGQLQAHIDTIILSLPEDLQGILHKPPSP